MVLIHDNSEVLSIGDALPHFSLQATDGMTVDSSMIKDPVLVVIFTCNHCPYAQAYDERILELAEQFDEAGAQFVLISSNDADNYPEDSFEHMKEKHDDLHWPFPYCFDETQEVARSFGALCTPHCFVFDAERTLQYKGRVDDNWQESDEVTEFSLHDAVEALVDGKTPLVQEAHALGCSIKWK